MWFETLTGPVCVRVRSADEVLAEQNRIHSGSSLPTERTKPMVTKNQAFPSRFIRATPLKLTIAEAEMEDLTYQGKTEKKLVVSFRKNKKCLVLNVTNWDALVEITGESDSDNWAGHTVELFRSEANVRGKMVPCVRIRVSSAKAAKPAKAPEEPPPPDLNDAIPDFDEEGAA
jgi:hypothetical protein